MRRRTSFALVGGLVVAAVTLATAPRPACGQDDTSQDDAGADESPSIGAGAETAETPETETSVLDEIDAAFGTYLVQPLAWVLFFDLYPFDNEDPHAASWPAVVRPLYLGAAASEKHTEVPFIVLWLILGALFFTLRMSFINVRGLRHAIDITRGKYDNPEEDGEVSHFQALSSALSATVGLGNIAGVAIAVSTGGPGAVFWMIVAGFFGMTSKFTECTLGQAYRKVEDGQVLGGPMRYLAKGLERRGFVRLGKVLSVMFCVMCIGGSFGGGNMFQANQAFAQTARVIPWFEGKSLLFGIIVAVLVGLVILGGIKRIGQVASAIVPVMCVVYMLAGIAVLVTNAEHIPEAFSHIVSEAFTPQAGMGGLMGVLVTGFKRAAFSNEAGIGSASIAHSAASTSEPVREGLVALLEPFIDTLIICTMTGLVVVVSGEYLHEPEGADSTIRGVLMTSAAFASVFDWFPYVLALAVFLFAFSTMISWSYYGERCCVYLFGKRSSLPYRILFLGFVILGSILKLANVTDFSDLMVLGMAFPNILGLLMLSREVRERLDRYWARYQSGGFEPRSS